MGQGTFQALPLLIAEELEVRLDQVDIQMSDGSGKFGSQLSGGSSSVKTRWIPKIPLAPRLANLYLKSSTSSSSEC
jgi:isoquinoline 1-oxidoreductase beta subunit